MSARIRRCSAPGCFAREFDWDPEPDMVVCVFWLCSRCAQRAAQEERATCLTGFCFDFTPSIVLNIFSFLPDHIVEQRRATMRFLLKGAPYSGNWLWRTRQVMLHHHGTIHWNGRLYHSRVGDDTIDFIDLVIQFLC